MMGGWVNKNVFTPFRRAQRFNFLLQAKVDGGGGQAFATASYFASLNSYLETKEWS